MTTPLSKWNMNSREFLFADPEGDSPVVLQMKVCFAVPSEETDSPGVKRSAPSSSFLQTKFCKVYIPQRLIIATRELILILQK